MTINYDNLVQEAMRSVIMKLLKDVECNGLPHPHYFRLSFLPGYKGVSCPKDIALQYASGLCVEIHPDKFDTLTVTHDHFSLNVYINERTERLVIPFDSITNFVDPHADFGLEFDVDHNNSKLAATDDAVRTDNVVVLDQFRNKK